MAVDQKAKRIALAANLVDISKRIVHAYYDFLRLDQQCVKDGIVFAAGDFDGTRLAYIDPLTTPLTLITELRLFQAFVETGVTVGRPTSADVLFKVLDGNA